MAEPIGKGRSRLQLPALAGLRRVAGNALALLFSDVVNRATTFILYALVARKLGSLAFGQMSLALTIFYTFQVLAAAGLRTLVARAIARDRDGTGHYLASGSLVAAAAALLSIAASAGFVLLMGYPHSTAVAIDLLSLGLLPFALSSVCEAVFIGWERMRFVTYANVPVNLAKVVVAFALLRGGFGLLGLMALMDVSLGLTLALEWLFLARAIPCKGLAPRLREAWRLARETLPFLGIDGVLAILGSANILLLSHFSGEQAVGFFSAGTQAMIPVMLVYQNVVTSLFPSMCRRFDAGPRGLRRVSEQLIGLLMIVALPVSVGFSLLAGPLVRLVYGPGLEGAVLALQIMIWSLILTAVTHVLGQVLIAGQRENTNLRIVALDGIAAVVFGLALIPSFGVTGAAIATVAVKLVDFVLHLVPVVRLFGGLRLLHNVWVPAAAAALMGLGVYWLAPYGLIPAILTGAVSYAAALLVLLLITSGGPDGLRRWALGLVAEVA